MEEVTPISDEEEIKRQEWQQWYEEWSARINKLIAEKKVLGECAVCHRTVIAETQADIEAWDLAEICGWCLDEGLMTCERRGG